jgi:hypothetical protein
MCWTLKQRTISRDHTLHTLNVSRGLGDIQQTPANEPRLSCGQSENGTRYPNTEAEHHIRRGEPKQQLGGVFCYDDEEERPKPRENCHCDNCFYGRDKLARYIFCRTMTNEQIIDEHEMLTMDGPASLQHEREP